MVALRRGLGPPSCRFIFGSLFHDESPTKKFHTGSHVAQDKKVCGGIGGRAMPASEKSANSSTQDGYEPDEVHRCSSSQCALCPKLTTGSSFSSSLTGCKYQVVCDSHMSCDSRHVVYLISCRQCGFQYVGETLQLLRCRINKGALKKIGTNPATKKCVAVGAKFFQHPLDQSTASMHSAAKSHNTYS